MFSKAISISVVVSPDELEASEESEEEIGFEEIKELLSLSELEASDEEPDVEPDTEPDTEEIFTPKSQEVSKEKTSTAEREKAIVFLFINSHPFTFLQI